MIASDVLSIDAANAITAIGEWIRVTVLETLHRRGTVVGLSGGIDSSVCAALCVHALGPQRVFGVFMPERDSASDSLRLGRIVAESLGIAAVVEPIGPALTAAGCYERQNEAIREVFPEYGDGYKCKISMPSVVDSDRLNFAHLIIQSPDGEIKTSRMTARAYLKLIAATNYKQRLRKTTEYYHADRLAYAVVGTPNLLEYDQGFFVKQGDGAADVKPIAHLYKTQVYALAKHLGIPEEVQLQLPTTDTFSMPQTQEEFFFSLPYAKMDICLYGKNHSISPDELAPLLGLESVQVERVYRDIDAKRRAARYLHSGPLIFTSQ